MESNTRITATTTARPSRQAKTQAATAIQEYTRRRALLQAAQTHEEQKHDEYGLLDTDSEDSDYDPSDSDDSSIETETEEEEEDEDEEEDSRY